MRGIRVERRPAPPLVASRRIVNRYNWRASLELILQFADKASNPKDGAG